MIDQLNASLLAEKASPRHGAAPRSLINPATEETFHEVFDVTAEDVDGAAKSAFAAWEGGWRDLAPGGRADLLYKLANLIEQNAAELGALDSRSMGKPLLSAQGEAASGGRTFRYYAGAIGRANGEVIPVARGGFDFTLRQPLGVVACIVPWNFPLAIACWKVAPALAMGNCVLLKPAAQTPLGALALGRLALEAGIPPGVLQVLCGEGGVIGDALVTHPLVRKVSFTGSTAIGRHVMEKAAHDFKRLSLELGGKSPNIIFADSDWEKAADTAPMAVFDNTGQDCCARSRIFVERAIFKPFVERMVEATKRLRMGEPDDPATDLGPLVSAERRNTVEAYLKGARQSGRKIECGGDRPAGRGFYLRPAVITGVETSDACWKEEIFGPVACVRAFDDEEAMLREVNDSPYGLSGSLWTRDLARALRVARRVEAGVISINCHNSVHTEAPFGGWKQSGLGRDLGQAALEGFSELKNIYISET